MMRVDELRERRSKATCIQRLTKRASDVELKTRFPEIVSRLGG
jgi:hypothetical protein